MNPEKVASSIDTVLKRFETLLRYMAPGFVALIVTVWVGPKCGSETIECQKSLTSLGNVSMNELKEWG